MQEGPLLMTQADRDRLVTLKKAKKKLITQREAAEELGLSVRHVKRLLYELKRHGDKAVIHGLRGKSSNRFCERLAFAVLSKSANDRKRKPKPRDHVIRGIGRPRKPDRNVPNNSRTNYSPASTVSVSRPAQGAGARAMPPFFDADGMGAIVRSSRAIYL
jgi:hypothetical protein